MTRLMHHCYLCKTNETTTALCATCASDLEALDMKPPPPDASEEEVFVWLERSTLAIPTDR